MSNLKFLLHLLALLLLQLGIFDHFQFHSYIYVNIYILIIYILPFRFNSLSILFFGFLLGLFIDLMNHTMGIHAVATTFLAYLRLRLLMLLSNNEQLDDIQGRQRISHFAWFFKYILISTFIFNVIMILCEVFNFQNFFITLLRILCSTIVSIFFILLYYFLALKKKKN